jgi:F0F1-type ATP synthase assembly protein I
LKEQNKPTDYLEFLSLGGEIAAGILGPILIGYGLDNYFETSPWLLLVGCIVGIVNTFILIFKLNERLNK